MNIICKKKKIHKFSENNNNKFKPCLYFFKRIGAYISSTL